MWTYYPELLETPVPRYTSFPTAAEFGPGVGPDDLLQALAASTDAVSLYAHIPFCSGMCGTMNSCDKAKLFYVPQNFPLWNINPLSLLYTGSSCLLFHQPCRIDNENIGTAVLICN